VAVTGHAGGCWNVGVHCCCGRSCGGFRREGDVGSDSRKDAGGGRIASAFHSR